MDEKLYTITAPLLGLPSARQAQKIRAKDLAKYYLPGINDWALEIVARQVALDLSSPDGASVNDAIAEECCSLSYVTVDDAAKEVLRLGAGSLLAKVDVKSTYRVVPVHPCR